MSVWKPLSLRKRGWTCSDTQCASIWDTDNLSDEFIDAKDLIDKQLVYQKKPIDKKMDGHF